MKLFPRFRDGRLLSYYVRFDGGSIMSLKTRNKQRASQAYRKIEKAYFKGRVSKICGECTKRLGEYRDEWQKWAIDIQKKKTFNANRLALNKLVIHAGKTIFLDRLSAKHIDLMIAAEMKAGNSIHSINNYIRHSKAVLNKAVEWGYLQKNPLAGVKQLKTTRQNPNYLKKSEIAPFIKTIKCVDLRRFVTALIATGRRRSELHFLEWSDVDFENNCYTIRADTTKGSIEETYGINRLFKAVLLAIAGNSDIGSLTGKIFNKYNHPDTWTHKVKDALRAAGFANLHLHHFRHSFATLKVEEGRSMREIQGLLGHKDINATKIYAHIGQNHLTDIGEVEIGPVSLGE